MFTKKDALLLGVLALSASMLPTTARAELIPAIKTKPSSFNSTPTDFYVGELAPQLAQTQQEGAESSNTLRLRPQMGIDFRTGPDTGYESSFGGIYGFIPFSQAPLQSSFFGEGRLNLFTQSEIGGNLRVGYRQYLPGSNLVWGSYVGYDLRHTEFDETFHQLGMGVDLQAADWEVRLNGYLPIGDTRREVSSASSFSDTGTVRSNLRFSGNNLVFDEFRQQNQTTRRQFEAAAGGFDLEGSYRLFDWSDGSLYGHLGGYYLDIPKDGSYFGVRGRLSAEISDHINAGVSISSDGNYGTNVALQVALLLNGQSTRTQDETPAESVLARLGQPVHRQETLAIDRQQTETVSVTTSQDEGVVAINPTTGQSWRFVHVTDGVTAGNGTVESPFGEVTTAVSGAQTTGNDVIYVDAGDRSGMDGFIIPDNVPVLSTGVAQSLDLLVSNDAGGTQTISELLPGSNTVTLPLIDGAVANTDVAFSLGTMVQMGTNSTLSGFEIQSTTAGATGVAATDTSGYTITNNQISTTGATGFGIAVLENAGTSSDITISNNTVSTTQAGASGIVLFNATGGGTIDMVTIADNQVSTTGNAASAIAILHQAGAGITSDITISGNTTETNNIGAHGIAITTLAGTATNLAIDDNIFSVADVTSRGLTINAQPTSTICISRFADNTLNSAVALTADYDIEAQGTVNFVDFGNISVNNTNFNTGTENPVNSVNVVTGC